VLFEKYIVYFAMNAARQNKNTKHKTTTYTAHWNHTLLVHCNRENVLVISHRAVLLMFNIVQVYLFF